MNKQIFKFPIVATILASFIGFTSCEDEDNVHQLGNWMESAEFPGIERTAAVCFVIDNVAYVGTGANTKKTEERERFKDFYSCTAMGERLSWVGGSKWDQTGQGVSSMPEVDDNGNIVEARCGAVAFALNGKGYVGLGYSGYHYLKDFWEFDPKGTPDPSQYPTMYKKMTDAEKANFGKNADGTPTGKWTRIADYPGDSCWFATAFTLKNPDGKRYAYVGSGEDYDQNLIGDFYKFDGEKWTSSEPLEHKRAQACSFTYEIDGIEYGYVVTGKSGGNGGSEYAERYNPVTKHWESLNQMVDHSRYSYDDDYGTNLLVYGATAFVLYDKAYIATGGSNGVAGTGTWEYDPAGDFWIRKTNFESKRKAGGRVNAVSFVLEHDVTSSIALQYSPSGKQFVPYLTTGGAQQVGHSSSGGTFYSGTFLFNPYQAYEELD